MFYIETVTNENLDKFLEDIEDWSIFIDFLNNKIIDDEFDYTWFSWKDLISLNLYNFFACYDTDDNPKKLQGICAFRLEDKKFHMNFLATAPWNYHKLSEGKKYEYLLCKLENNNFYRKKRVGSFILNHLIKIFEDNEEMLEFFLISNESSMRFYASKKEILTAGNMTGDGLREYYRRKDFF